jgi:hypothetical protein
MDSRALLFLSNRRGGLEPIHHRHLHIDKDQIKTLFFNRRQRLASIRRHYHEVAPLFQQPTRQLLIHGIVFGQQNAERSREFAGIVQ